MTTLTLPGRHIPWRILAGLCVVAAAVGLVALTTSAWVNGSPNSATPGATELPLTIPPHSAVYRSESGDGLRDFIEVRVDYESPGNFRWEVIDSSAPEAIGQGKVLSSGSANGFPCVARDRSDEGNVTSCAGPESPGVRGFYHPVLGAQLLGLNDAGMTDRAVLEREGWTIEDVKPGESLTLSFFGVLAENLGITDEERRADDHLNASLAPSRQFLVTYSLETGALISREEVLDGETIERWQLVSYSAR